MPPLRIGTWNVEYACGADKNARRLAILRQHVADVWVLTETHDDLSLAETHAAISTTPRAPNKLKPGARWTTIWSRFPVLERVPTQDPDRTVAALLDAPVRPLLVYGTVLPWHSDPGPDPTSPAKAWAEMDRVLPLQLAEWADLRRRYPDAALCVAGDLNLNLGGKHVYGTARARNLLLDGLVGLELSCATHADRVPEGWLTHPPIDHVVVPAVWQRTTRVVAAWNGIVEGVRLSDHSGLVVEVEPV